METIPLLAQPRTPILSLNHPERLGTDGNNNCGNDDDGDDGHDGDGNGDGDDDDDETVELACEALVQVLSITSD